MADERRQQTYFMGVGGTGMGHGALLARQLGDEVWGADERIYPPMDGILARAGLTVESGYDPARLAARAPDCVVIGNAQTRGHPEIEALLRSDKLTYTSLPAWLWERVLRGRRRVVVAGTHGKTTTAAMTAFVLRAMGTTPGWFIGGVPRDLPAGAELGDASAPFIIEGDEYDSAFFDKRAKFIHYRPHVLVLTNLEFDHADIYRDLEDLMRAYRHLLRLVPRDGAIVASGDDPCLRELLREAPAPVTWVGFDAANDIRLAQVAEASAGISASLAGTLLALSLAGRFNLHNAALAITATAAALRTPFAEVLPYAFALREFQGVRRRQEVRFASEGITVVEDFAHHPTAIAVTLQAVRGRFPGRPLVAVFEPRSNTLRTRRFQAELTDALAHADEVFLGPVHRAELLPDSERLDTTALASTLRQRGGKAEAFGDFVALEAGLPTGGGAVVVFLSNGALGGALDSYLNRLSV